MRECVPNTTGSRYNNCRGQYMRVTETQKLARTLYESIGPRALAEATQRANAYARDGRVEDARTWRLIEEALHLMRGPRAS